MLLSATIWRHSKPNISSQLPQIFEQGTWRLFAAGKAVMCSSLSSALVTIDVVLSIFASIFVGLRFKARSYTKAGLATDDFVILGALVCFSHDSKWGFTEAQKLLQYAGAAVDIYSAVKGGTGDSEQHLFMHPSEVVANAKVASDRTDLA